MQFFRKKKKKKKEEMFYEAVEDSSGSLKLPRNEGFFFFPPQFSMSYITVIVMWYSKQGGRGHQSSAEAVLLAKTVPKSLKVEREASQLWLYVFDSFHYCSISTARSPILVWCDLALHKYKLDFEQ